MACSMSAAKCGPALAAMAVGALLLAAQSVSWGPERSLHLDSNARSGSRAAVTPGLKRNSGTTGLLRAGDRSNAALLPEFGSDRDETDSGHVPPALLDLQHQDHSVADVTQLLLAPLSPQTVQALPRTNVPDSSGMCCVSAGAESACVRAGTRMAFRDNALCERGTTIAIFDYADAWERLLCGEAWISSQDSDIACPANNMISTAARFRARFGDRMFTTDRWWSTVDADLARVGVGTLYQIMAGDVAATGTLPKCARNAVHAVFSATSPHGDAYASVSPEVPAAPGVPVVLHIVKPPIADAGNMRSELGIASDARVFCRHGGSMTFDIDFVRDALCAMLNEAASAAHRPWLLFLNTQPLACATAVSAYGRVVYLPGTDSNVAKARFLGTCDACLHARVSGESFGLAVAECAMAGLPVITHGAAGSDGDFHLDTLGDYALKYVDGKSLRAILDGFDPAVHRPLAGNYSRLYARASEERVMIDFVRAFQPDAPSKCAAEASAPVPALSPPPTLPPPQVPQLPPQRSLPPVHVTVPNAAGECCVSWRGESACVRSGTRVAFRDNALCERGTTSSLFDYADAWERLLCGVAYISSQDSDTVCPAHGGVSTAAAFRARFGERVFTTDRWWAALDADLAAANITALYQQMDGHSVSSLHPRCARNLVHAVFFANEPHGDAYAAISPALPLAPGVPVVTYMVKAVAEAAADAALSGGGGNDGASSDDLRATLGIAPRGLSSPAVLCRHGGFGTFDIGFVRRALCEYLAAAASLPGRPWLLLLNTAPLHCPDAVAGYGRLLYLPATTTAADTARFLRTCDGCLHGRHDGESFGKAVAECSNAGLPVITHGGGGPPESRPYGSDGNYHLDALGTAAIIYNDGKQLTDALDGFDVRAHRARAGEYKQLYQASSPEAVMLDFVKAFRPDAPPRC